jgi:hypothetical protein
VIRLSGTISFRDGRVVGVEVRQAEYAAWELYAMRHGFSAKPDQSPPMTMTRYLAFAAIQREHLKPIRDWDDFDDWSLQVDDVELDSLEGVDQGKADVPPTLQDRSDD